MSPEPTTPPTPGPPLEAPTPPAKVVDPVATTRYRYAGPVCATNIAGQEVQLSPGRVVELPAGEPYVKTLVRLGHLKVEPEATEADAPKGPAKKKGGK